MLVRIILKSGNHIDIVTKTSLETIKKIILEHNDFLSIGENFIRIEDISAVLIPV
jgi:hypothetical protein